ncbi:transcriptional regulator family: Fungal Specific TF [Trichoderma aggressivum f. europaeum]|uniref:Transcriptional regulator family: Fungal Specific TF n=1 Tax=Trichoderma aggressivum f. europaeum TaxID=173218 RepID=A0AAE1M5W2_9HYPO|nr:transcriptional regulator family: Fungal Specific TF [Trichoderma aggressivum f. europaeum]
MMREAFMELERTITVSDRAQLKHLSLEDVQQAALQVEKQLSASQSLRNMRRLSPLFTGLGYYSQAIEVLCNGTPYMPWLWAPIKLVLKISADYIEAFEQIIKVYSRLAEPLARFRLFDRSFSNNMEVQNTLAVYYSDILKFHGEVYKFVRRNAWQRLFATSWGRFQRRFDNIFADLKAHEDLVDKTVNAANVSEAKEMREKLEDWRQQEMAKLKKEEEERTSTEFRAVLSVLKVDETHQIKVFDNLISEANRNPGSCSWILQQSKIRSWARCERDTQFVVLHGFVGSGKSVLAAQIATFLRASEQSLVAAHFCTYLYPESTDYNSIMRSLMIQIIRLDPELITLSYDWLILKKKAPSNTVVEQLLRFLVEAMGALPEKQKTLHIIVDGLDECDDSMFLWAKLVMEYINKNLFYHRDEILKAAISLPRELGEFYGRMLSQIMANFDERSAQRISAVLSWIAFAKRPLRLAELLSALAFDTNQEQVDELVPAYILDRCEPLIQKQADSSYSFVHVSVRDFLQSSDTALLVTDIESQRRHGLATIRCLLSGQQLFATSYSDSERILRVLRGLHGFHMYATEFWTDYLLASLEFGQAQFFDSDFFALSCRLAKSFTGSKPDCEATDSSLSDPRLALIRQKDYRLYKMVKVVLLEQNKEALEVVSIHDDTACIQHDDTASDVITLKKRYQETIQKLLNYSTYPGVSFQQLEQFKQNFRTSAFTCRLWSCPHAALGFNNIDSLTRHEAEHSKHICRVQGCQYPVFTSARLLKNHVAEHHTSPDQRLKRSSIRKRPALVNPSGRDNVTHMIEAPEDEPYVYTIKCICSWSGVEGNTIHCENCDTWQHIDCYYPENPEEALQVDFPHSCKDCKSLEPLSQTATKRYTNGSQRRNADMLKQKNIGTKSNIASLLNDSPGARPADIPPQANTHKAQANPLPPPPIPPISPIEAQFSQMAPQMASYDAAPKHFIDPSIQDYQMELMRKERRQRESDGLHQTAIAAQKSRQDEDGRRPLNNNNQPASEQGPSITLTHYGSEIVPKLDRTMTDVYDDEFYEDKTGWTTDNGSLNDEFKLFNDDELNHEDDLFTTNTSSNAYDLFNDESSHDDAFKLFNEFYNPSLTTNSSPQTNLSTAESSDVFNQRISAANSQRLNTIQNSPSSSTSQDTSPYRQHPPLPPLPLHDSASQPRMSSQGRNALYYYRDPLDYRDPRDPRDTTPQPPQKPARIQAAEQQRLKTRYQNGLPLPIPPHLKVEGPRPPPPPPPPPLPPTPPLKAAGFPSTLPDSTPANKIPYPSVIFPYGLNLTASPPLALPPLVKNFLRERTCNFCLWKKIKCDGINPCDSCVTNGLFCAYKTIYNTNEG